MKEQLLKIITEEMTRWQEYYQHTTIHLYSIITACFRAEAKFVEDETKKVEKTAIFAVIDEYLASIEDDEECVNAIYNVVVNTFDDIAIPFIGELIEEGKKDGRTLSKLTATEALADVENELIARQHINEESLVAMRTLQWVADKIRALDETGGGQA